MTGLPDFNFAAFIAAAQRWRDAGHEVVSPAELDDGDTSKSWAYYLRRDLVELASCDALAVLPGWQNSKGASLEVTVAQALDMPVLDADSMESYHEPVTLEANRLVDGPRAKAYGHPADDFARSGRMWGAILNIPDVAPEKVGLCMAAVKISREVNLPARDNRVDLAGYAETIEKIMVRREKPVAESPCADYPEPCPEHPTTGYTGTVGIVRYLIEKGS